VSVLCGTGVTFPIHLWYCTLRQTEHQLNLLIKTRVNPIRSKCIFIHGEHNPNANPFAPLGSVVKMRAVPSKKKTWEYQTKTGGYQWNSWKHYTCHTILIMATISVRSGNSCSSNTSTSPRYLSHYLTLIYK
jgi:hypothetical protein